MIQIQSIDFFVCNFMIPDYLKSKMCYHGYLILRFYAGISDLAFGVASTFLYKYSLLKQHYL